MHRMTQPRLRFAELGISLPLGAAGVRIIAMLQLLLVAAVLAAAAAVDVPDHLRAIGVTLMLGGSTLALVTTIPALLGGRFRFWLAGIGSIATTLVVLVLAGLVGSWPAHLFGWALLAVSMIAVAYHLVGDPTTRRR